MREDDSFPLRILGGAPQRAPWQLPSPYPTTLIALWPGSKPPTLEIVLEALMEAQPDVAVLGEMAPPPESLWLFAVDLPAPMSCRVLVFAESSAALPMRDMPQEDGTADAVRRCRHAVGLEFIAPRERVLAVHAEAMRLLATLVPETPAILDVASSMWHYRDGLRRWFLIDEPDPPCWMLWSTHAVSRRREFLPGEPAWLRTAGLWRCGLPELEILELPCERIQEGIELINGVATLLLETSIPAPLTRWRIGHGVEVALVPWQRVAATLEPETPGSFATRQIDADLAESESLAHPYGGVRAVLCDPEPRGLYRPLWAWPQEALERLARGDGSLEEPEGAALRTQRAAQRTLPVLRDVVERFIAPGAHSTAGATESPRALVEIALALDDGAGALKEHVWLEVMRCASGDDGVFECTALDDPTLSGALRGGARHRVASDQVTDWQVRFDRSVAGPDEADTLVEALEARRRVRAAGVRFGPPGGAGLPGGAGPPGGAGGAGGAGVAGGAGTDA